MSTRAWSRLILLLTCLLYADSGAGQPAKETVIWYDLTDNFARYDSAAPPPSGIQIAARMKPNTAMRIAELLPLGTGELAAYTSKVAPLPQGSTSSRFFAHSDFVRPGNARSGSDTDTPSSPSPMSLGCSGYDYPTVTVNIVFNFAVVGVHWATFWRSYDLNGCVMWSQQGHSLDFGPGGECEEWDENITTESYYDYSFYTNTCYRAADFNVWNWGRASTYPVPRGYASWHYEAFSNKTGREFESFIGNYPYYE